MHRVLVSLDKYWFYFLTGIGNQINQMYSSFATTFFSKKKCFAREEISLPANGK